MFKKALLHPLKTLSSYDLYLKLAYTLLIAFIVSSTVLAVYLPPFQGPDEWAHWENALRLNATKERKCSFAASLSSFFRASTLRFNPEQKIITGLYAQLDSMEKNCNYLDGVKIDYATAWTYPSVKIVSSIIKGEHRKPRKALLFYLMSRITSSLLISITLFRFIYLCTTYRSLPVPGVLSILTLSISPIFLQQSAIITADLPLTIFSLSLLTFFLFWGKLSWFDVIIFFCSALGAASKPIILPVAVTLLFIKVAFSPQNGFNLNPKKWCFPRWNSPEGCAFLVVFLHCVYAIIIVLRTSAGAPASSPEWANPTQQLAYVTSNPWEVFKILNKSLYNTFEPNELANTLGWVDTKITFPKLWSNLFYIALIIDLIFAITLGIKRYIKTKNLFWGGKLFHSILKIDPIFAITSSIKQYIKIRNLPAYISQNVLLLLAVYTMLILSALSIYITWNPLRADFVAGFQQRYFLPPLLIGIIVIFDLISLNRTVTIKESRLKASCSSVCSWILVSSLTIYLVYQSASLLIDLAKRYY